MIKASLQGLRETNINVGLQPTRNLAMSSSCDEQLNKPTEITSAVPASQRNKDGIRMRYLCYGSLIRPRTSQGFSECVVDGRHKRAGRLSLQRCEARAFQVVAIKQIVRIERNQASVGMHDVDAGFLYGAHIECVGIQKLHNEHTENIFVGQLTGRRDFWQTAQKFAQ